MKLTYEEALKSVEETVEAHETHNQDSPYVLIPFESLAVLLDTHKKIVDHALLVASHAHNVLDYEIQLHRTRKGHRIHVKHLAAVSDTLKTHVSASIPFMPEADNAEHS